MRLENVSTKEFLESLDEVGNAVSTKSPIPCLTSVYLKVNDDKIILLGSDTNTAIKKVLFKEDENFNVIENGECLVEYKLFKAILSKLNNDLSVFYTKDNQFVIENGKSVYRLNMINAEEYPKIEFKKLENEIILKTEDLKSIISNVSFACSTSEKKPILTGVNFNCSNSELNCVGTDTYRLAKFNLNLENVNDVNFTFPRQSLIALDKIINKTKEEFITILYDNKNEIVINVDNVLYKTRLLDGNYPNTDKIFANTYSHKVKIDKQQLIDIIDRLNVLAKVDINYCIVKIEFKNDGTLIVTSTNSQIGNAKETMEYSSDDKFDLTLACNSDFLIQALNSFNQELVEINLQSELRPFCITSEENSNLIQILLPVKVQ